MPDNYLRVKHILLLGGQENEKEKWRRLELES